MTADVSPVLLEVADGVATITFNRPEAMNSLDVATKEALLASLTAVGGDSAVGWVVLTGNGGALCGGPDAEERVAVRHAAAPQRARRDPTRPVQRGPVRHRLPALQPESPLPGRYAQTGHRGGQR